MVNWPVPEGAERFFIGVLWHWIDVTGHITPAMWDDAIQLAEMFAEKNHGTFTQHAE
jgi:hypothetical protein